MEIQTHERRREGASRELPLRSGLRAIPTRWPVKTANIEFHADALAVFIVIIISIMIISDVILELEAFALEFPNGRFLVIKYDGASCATMRH